MAKCPHCGFETPPGFSICPECGFIASTEEQGDQRNPDIVMDSTNSNRWNEYIGRPRGGGSLPPGARDDDYREPPSLHESSKLQNEDIGRPRGGGSLPPGARDDDYREPPSLHKSSNRWIVISVVVMIVLVVATVALLYGGLDINGDENAPLEGFRPQLSYEKTEGKYISTPKPGYSVLAVVENIGDDSGSLDGWCVHVTLEIEEFLAAEEREYLAGQLGSKEMREIAFNLEIGELEIGDEIKLTVILRNVEDHLYSIRVLRQILVEE